MSIINTFKYKYDCLDYDNQKETNHVNEYKSKILSNSIRISPEIFPEIYNKIQDTILDLDIENNYDFFISSDNNLNASCFSVNKNMCFILINSKIFDILSLDELMFIVGHEIAHHYFSHKQIHQDVSSNTDLALRNLYLLRNMEITCDRLGLAAVKDFNIAAKAILKIVSGITDKYLTNNFDIFLDQLKELKNIGLQDDKYQTHNNWLLRLQALKLFSHSSEYCEYLSQDSRNRKSLDEIDSIISSGIDRFVGYKFDLLFSDESDRIFIWLSAYLILKNSTQHQLVLDEKLSKISKPATVKKLINYITSSDDASIKKKLYEQSLTLEVVPVMIKNNIFDKICEFVSQFHEINDTEITLIKKILNV